MNADEITQQKELSWAALENACSGEEITPDSWGMFEERDCYSDGFYWFAAQRELLDYLAQHWIWTLADVTDEFRVQNAPRVREWVRQYDSNELSQSEFLEVISTLNDDQAIEWLGTLSDLMEGKGDFAYKVLEMFRSRGIPGDRAREPKPVTSKKLPAFLEFLAEIDLWYDLW